MWVVGRGEGGLREGHKIVGKSYETVGEVKQKMVRVRLTYNGRWVILDEILWDCKVKQHIIICIYLYTMEDSMRGL